MLIFKRFLRLLLLALMPLVSTPLLAADFASGMRAYETGNFEAAIRELSPLAEQGNAKAQYQMGLIYHNGDGIPQSYKEASKWFRRAAEKGNVDAQVALGRMFSHGQGITQDWVMAYVWLNLAVAQGDDEYGLGQKGRRMAEINMTSEQLTRAQALSQEYYRKYVLTHQPGRQLPAQISSALPAKTQSQSQSQPQSQPVGSGEYKIQLGAIADKSKTLAEWQRLQKRYPAELGELQLTIDQANLGQNRVFYRIQAGPLDKARAISMCRTLRQKHQQNCLVVKP